MFAALAESIRELIIIGTNEGLATARARAAEQTRIIEQAGADAARSMSRPVQRGPGRPVGLSR